MTTPNVEIDQKFLEALESVVYVLTKDAGLRTETIKRAKQLAKEHKESK